MMKRDNWQNLNGEWLFEFDFGNSGAERGLFKPENKDKYSKKITVLFCPESELSGINYDLKFTYETENGTDVLFSYAGLRDVRIDGFKVLINGKSVFQRTVLDRGFYPDGIYTAPSDAALKRDIELSMQLGFNGARLHEKMFEPRFLYHCDKAGYLVWGEHANWGLDIDRESSLLNFLPE